MQGRCYLIDPGADMLRLYDPKTRSVLSMRSCYLSHHPLSIGEQALKDIWQHPKDRLVYPFFAQKIEKDPAVLVRSLFEKAPAERFWMHPKAAILCERADDAEQLSLWNRQLAFHRFASMDLKNPFPVRKDRPFFHVHAGASETVFALCLGGDSCELHTIACAGLSIDKAIADSIASKWRVVITMEDARALKHAASESFRAGRNARLKVTGLDQRKGFVEIEFPAGDLWPAMESVLRPLAREASEFLCSKGADAMERMLESPVLLSGGLAECYGLEQYLEQYLSCNIEIPQNPADWLLLQTAGRAS